MISGVLEIKGQAPYVQIISSEKGFGTTGITCLKEDHQGIVWAGTQLGLIRYDGVRNIKYVPKPGDANSLSNEFINDLYEDRDGNLWVATRNGLTCIDPSRKKFTRYYTDSDDTTSIPGNGIFQIMPDSDSTFLIVCGMKGLARFHLNNRKITRLKPKIVSENKRLSQMAQGIFEVYKSSNQHFFIRTNVGILEYDVETDLLTDIQDTITGIREIDNYADLYVSQSGDLWLTNAKGILFKWLPGQYLICREDSLISSAFASGDFRIFEFDQQNMLLTSAAHCLLVDKMCGYIRPLEVRADQQSKVSYSLARTCIQTSSRIRIIGTNQGNLYLTDPSRQPFKYKPVLYEEVNQDVQAEVSSFYEDTFFKKLYISAVTDSFFYVEDMLSGAVRPFSKKRIGNVANNWMMDHLGRLWLCDGTGVQEVNRITHALTPHYPATEAMNIFDMAEVKPGKIMVASLGHGLFWFEPDKQIFQSIPPGKGWTKTQVISLKWDKVQQSLWIGTVNRGVFRYDAICDTFYNYVSHSRNPNAIGGDQVRDITIDSMGYAWFAVEPIGLSRFDYHVDPDAAFVSYTMEEGLPSSYISGLETDPDGKLWMTTLNGIASLDPSIFAVQHYSKGDGLPATKFTRASLYITQDHEVMASCRSGYLFFNSRDLVPNAILPGLIIDDILVFDKSIMAASIGSRLPPLKLTYKENYITIAYSVINYTEPELNSVMYKMEGLDEQWSKRIGGHEVSYTNIPPGKYTFKMLAANNDGLWNPEQATIDIFIRPPYWERTWFYLLLGGMVSGIIFWFYHYNLTQSVKRNALLTERELMKAENERQLSQLEMKALRAQMNPHFIFNCLNSINRFIVVNDNDAASEYLTKFARLIRQVLDNSRGEKVLLLTEVETLKLYIEMEALRFADRFDYHVVMDEGLDPASFIIQPMLIQPYVENAIWHGLMHRKSKGRLDIRFSVKGLVLLVTIEDNGVGRDMAKSIKEKQMIQRQSHGMKVTAERMTILSKKLNVPVEAEVNDLYDSAGVAVGTRVALTLPLEHVPLVYEASNKP